MNTSTIYTKTIRPVLAAALLGMVLLSSAFAGGYGISGDGVQQSDPKGREIITSLVRREDVVVLTASFPEDTPQLKLGLYTMLGKLVQVHPTTTVERGEYGFVFPLRGLPGGPYILILEANGQRIVNKFMLSR